MAIKLTHRDRLELDLKAPLLDEFMRSPRVVRRPSWHRNADQSRVVSRVTRDTGDLAARRG